MALPCSTRPVRIERTVHGDVSSPLRNLVEVRKFIVFQLQKEGLEFFCADQGRISSGDADWEIETDDCGATNPSLIPDAAYEKTMITN